MPNSNNSHTTNSADSTPDSNSSSNSTSSPNSDFNSNSHSSNGNSTKPFTEQESKKWEEFKELVYNVATSRAQLLSQFTDPRREINKECGYPDYISVEMYQQAHDRNAIAARVNEVLPLESWQVTPAVYEKESATVTTPFEKDWVSLGRSLQLGQKSWYRSEHGSPVWEYLKRADILSGIGHYGVIVIGIDDGQDLSTPVKGVEVSVKELMGGFNSSLSSSNSGSSSSSNATSTSLPTSTSSKLKTRNLTYLKVFSERLAEITQFESDRNNPRFGHPNMYLITVNDPREHQTGIGLTYATLNVHWTRVIHVADNMYNSEVFAFPRTQQVFDEILDCKKVRGGSAEMYWRGAFPGLAIETHPSLGGDTPVDRDAMREMMENYMNGLQRYLSLLGFSAKSLAPQVVDPRPQIEVQLEAVCIKLGIPLRIFKGSERGQLASQQDESSWNDRVAARQSNYLTPRLIVPFVNRLIAMGVLSEPEEGFTIEWPKLDSLIESDLANVSLTKTKSIAAYATGGGPSVMAPIDFFTDVMNFNDAKSKQLVESAAQYRKENPEVVNPKGSNPDNVGGNNFDTQGDKVSHGRSPSSMHLPVSPSNNTLLNNDLTEALNEISEELNLNEEDRELLYEQCIESFRG